MQKFLPTLLVTIIILFVGVFTFRTGNHGIQNILKQKGFKTDLKDITFHSHPSQKIEAYKNSIKIDIRKVLDVTENDKDEITNFLYSPVDDSVKEFSVIDPYSGENNKYSIPIELAPQKHEATINGNRVSYYVVYANEILALKIFSKDEVKYKGLFSAFYCSSKSESLNIQIFDYQDKFDEKAMLALLSDLYCK